MGEKPDYSEEDFNECFKFFYDHENRKKNNAESMFPQEKIKIYFNLNNPQKI